MQLVHLKCLQNWLQVKLVSKQNPRCLQIDLSNLRCELCQQ